MEKIKFLNDKSELTKLGLWEIYFKQKLKFNFFKEVEELKPSIQERIIKEWKLKHSIKSKEEFDNWLSFNCLTIEEWKDLINKDYLWTSWCLRRFKNELSDYYQQQKVNLDYYYFSIIEIRTKVLADELYLRIKEKESSFQEIAIEFAENDFNKIGYRFGPLLMKDIDLNIRPLIKISELNKLRKPTKIKNKWALFNLDGVINSEFNNKTKIILALQLGEKFLHQQFTASKNNKNAKFNSQ